MSSYMFDPRLHTGIARGSNVVRCGPDETLRCPNTIARHGGHTVCGKPFGKMNPHGFAQIRVLTRASAALRHAAFLHRCRDCKAILEVVVGSVGSVTGPH